MEYLGTILSNDVHDQHELVRRIGLAKADYRALSNVWRRSALTWQRKLNIFQTLVESKLLYSLASTCLTKAQENTLNAFQNRCLRGIIGVAPSFQSRASNKEVLRRCGVRSATDLLMKRQLVLLGKILRCPEGHPLRMCCFIPGTDRPATERFVRRVGRPAKEWVRTVMDQGNKIFGSKEDLRVAASVPSTLADAVAAWYA